jgi:hypothetical protein
MLGPSASLTSLDRASVDAQYCQSEAEKELGTVAADAPSGHRLAPRVAGSDGAWSPCCPAVRRCAEQTLYARRQKAIVALKSKWGQVPSSPTGVCRAGGVTSRRAA